MNVTELRQWAKRLGIKKYYKMNKRELFTSIIQKQNERIAAVMEKTLERQKKEIKLSLKDVGSYTRLNVFNRPSKKLQGCLLDYRHVQHPMTRNI